MIGRVTGRPEPVFINVPFDRAYKKLFHALVFAVHDSGFLARCALESADGSESRMSKLYAIIEACPLGIHDLSRTTLDSENKLPRFNMPLELGLFLGAKRYGRGNQRKKSCLILEKERYRYQKFCSDIAGQDIRAHDNTVEKAIGATRDWLRAARPSKDTVSGAAIARRYVQFRLDLPRICKSRDIDERDPPFLDYRTLIIGWQAENADIH